MNREVVDLYLDDIIPNRFQPREVFDEKALKELSDSIREHGVIQPIIVRKIGDKYEIIAGERRYKASALAGLTKIPAIIRNLDDKETSKVALLENLQRQDLTAIEEARTYQKILELDSMTQEELAKTMGKSQAAIANKLRLLALPDEVQEALLTNQISERHARSLLNLSNSQQQIDMMHKVIQNRMTVRELDNEIRKMQGFKDITANSIIDVNKLKEQTSDIYKPERQTANLDDLLRTDLNTSPQINDLNNNIQTNNNTEPQQKPFSFADRLMMPTEPIIIDDEDTEETPTALNNVPAVETLTTTNDSISYENKSTNIRNTKEAIDTIKIAAANIEKNGFSVKIDEMDFENTYQVIIKIDKKQE